MVFGSAKFKQMVYTSLNTAVNEKGLIILFEISYSFVTGPLL
jgi:hypothetical protein